MWRIAITLVGMDACARSEVYRRVSQAARSAGESFTGWLMLDPEQLRYRVDAGKAGWVMPYALESSLASQAEAALTELAVLYVSRNRRQLGEEAYDAVLLNAPASAARLGEPAYGAPQSVRNPAMARALERSARILPGLDASVLLGWWGADSRGRPWLASLTKLQVQAVEEMETAKAGELTPVMLQWVLYSLHAVSQKALAPFEWSAAVRKEIETALQIGLHLSHHLVRSRVAELRSLSDERYDRLRLTWDALLSPRLSFAGQLPLLGRCRFYPLELTTLGDGALDLTEILDDHGSEAAADKLRSWLGHDRDLARRMSAGLAVSSLRELLVQLLACGPAPGGELFAYLHVLLRSPSGGGALLDDKKRRKEACRFFEASAGQAAGSALAGQLAGLATRLKRHNPKHPARAWLAEDKQGQRIEQSLLAAAGDVLMDRVAGLVKQRLVPRTGAETDRSLGELYESGRLYRFGPGVKPFLKVLERTPQVGHYFIDVKDFTRQTAAMKEEGMAEIIRKEFYTPILDIAREFYHGLPQLADRGGVHLNNLLGDAVSMSGDVVSLVRIARQIRSHLTGYARKLAGQTGSAAGSSPLSSGSFISFGAPPSVLTFEDAVWGRLRVSIASKINESARGTARHGQVIDDLLAMLQVLRHELERPDLALPFRVYVGPVQGLPIPAAVERRVQRALEAGDRAAALTELGSGAQDWVDAALADPEAHRARAVALYNTGDALSGAALDAYRQAEAHRLRFVNLRLSTDQLGAEVRDRFAFFAPEIRLVAGLDRVTAQPKELFRLAGKLGFKGFEGSRPVEAWEMIDPGSPVFTPLVRCVQQGTRS